MNLIRRGTLLILLSNYMLINSCAQNVNFEKMEEIRKEMEKTFNPNVNKNYYALSLSSNGCNFEILVNDVPVYRYFEMGGATGMYPLNSKILKSGEQRIKVKLYPVKGHEEKGINGEKPLLLTLKYIEDPKHGLHDFIELLSDFIPRIEPGIPYFEYETTFGAQVPYDLEEVENCIDLRDIPDIKELMIRKYTEYGNMIINNDFQQLSDVLAYKNARISFSLYSTTAGMAAEMDEMFEKMKKYDRISSMDNYVVRFYGDGRFAILENPEDMEQGFKVENDDYEWCQLFFLGLRNGSTELEVIK